MLHNSSFAKILLVFDLTESISHAVAASVSWAMVLSMGKSIMAFVLVTSFATSFADPVSVTSLAGKVVVSDFGVIERVGD